MTVRFACVEQMQNGRTVTVHERCLLTVTEPRYLLTDRTPGAENGNRRGSDPHPQVQAEAKRDIESDPPQGGGTRAFGINDVMSLAEFLL